MSASFTPLKDVTERRLENRFQFVAQTAEAVEEIKIMTPIPRLKPGANESVLWLKPEVN